MRRLALPHFIVEELKGGCGFLPRKSKCGTEYCEGTAPNHSFEEMNTELLVKPPRSFKRLDLIISRAKCRESDKLTHHGKAGHDDPIEQEGKYGTAKLEGSKSPKDDGGSYSKDNSERQELPEHGHV